MPIFIPRSSRKQILDMGRGPEQRLRDHNLPGNAHGCVRCTLAGTSRPLNGVQSKNQWGSLKRRACIPSDLVSPPCLERPNLQVLADRWLQCESIIRDGAFERGEERASKSEHLPPHESTGPWRHCIVEKRPRVVRGVGVVFQAAHYVYTRSIYASD
jgi:hypothetical protein